MFFIVVLNSPTEKNLQGELMEEQTPLPQSFIHRPAREREASETYVGVGNCSVIRLTDWV